MNISVVFSMVAVLFLSGCFSLENPSAGDLDLVITLPQEGVEFSDYKTYSMPDTVVKIVEGIGRFDLPSDIDSLALKLIQNNLESRGYVRELNSTINPPDLVALVAAQKNDDYVFSDYPIWDFWGWWGGWFPDWGYGPGWTGGGALPIFQRYTTGTIFILMIDPNRPNEQMEEIPIIWSAVLNGLVITDKAENISRTTIAINQAFEQSLYLETN